MTPTYIRSMPQAAAVVVLCSVMAATFTPPQWVACPVALLQHAAAATGGVATAVVEQQEQEPYHGGEGGCLLSSAMVPNVGGGGIFKHQVVVVGPSVDDNSNNKGLLQHKPQAHDGTHHRHHRGGRRHHRVAALHDMVSATKKFLTAVWTLLSSIIMHHPHHKRGHHKTITPTPTTTTSSSSSSSTATTTTPLPATTTAAAAAAPPPSAAIHHPSSAGLVVDLTRLTEEQRQLVDTAFTSVLERFPGIVKRAEATALTVDRACVARYLMVSKWDVKTVVDLIEKTVRWREEERLAHLGPSDVKGQAVSGCLYVNGRDKQGRPVIYYRPARQDFASTDKAVRFLIYTLDRALHDASSRGLDAYSLVIDIDGLSYHNMPPLRAIQMVFHLLRFHYPMRVGFIAIVNAGPAFMLIWKVLWGLVCPYTREKITIVRRKDHATHLLQRVDDHHLEVGYGGRNTAKFDADTYLLAGGKASS